MKAQIATPVKGYNGFSVGVNFINGIGEADINESQLDYFKTSGYLVTLLEMPRLKAEEKKSETKSSPKPRGKGKKNAK